MSVERKAQDPHQLCHARQQASPWLILLLLCSFTGREQHAWGTCSPVRGGLRASWPKALFPVNGKKQKGKQFPGLSQLVTSRGLEELYFRVHQQSGPEKAHQPGAKCYHRCCTAHFCTAPPANYTRKTHQPCENTQIPPPAARRSLAPLQPGHRQSSMLVTCSSLKGSKKKKNPITRARHRSLKVPDSPASTWYQKNPNQTHLPKVNCWSRRPVAFSFNHGPWAPARATSAAPGRVHAVLAQAKTSRVPSASSRSRTWDWMHKRYFLNKLPDNRQHLPPPCSPAGCFFKSHHKNNVSYAARYF